MSHDLEFTIEGDDYAPTATTTSTIGLSGSMQQQQQQQSAAPNSLGMTGAAASSPPMSAPGPLYQLSQSAHPLACIFHFVFKLGALFLYIFGGWFVSDGSGGVSGSRFITVTVCCILLLAADFWVVKNITGRLLVGLRWWNKVEGDTTRWIFESAETQNVNQFDTTIFWTVLYATPLMWGALLVIGVLKFELGWLITVAMAISLSTANVYGYYKCSSDQKAKFRQMMQRGAEAGAMSMIRNNLFTMIDSATATSSTAMMNNGGNREATYV